MTTITQRRWRQIAMLFIAASVGLGVWAILIWRTQVANQQRNTLCGVIAAIVMQADGSLGQPGTPGYQYYRLHPDELRVAHQQNHQTLDELGCKPSRSVVRVKRIQGGT